MWNILKPFTRVVKVIEIVERERIVVGDAVRGCVFYVSRSVRVNGSSYRDAERQVHSSYHKTCKEAFVACPEGTVKKVEVLFIGGEVFPIQWELTSVKLGVNTCTPSQASVSAS